MSNDNKFIYNTVGINGPNAELPNVPIDPIIQPNGSDEIVNSAGKCTLQVLLITVNQIIKYL